MTDLFLKLVNMSLSAGVLILVVVLVRAVFQKSPKWLMCLFWALVAIRLVCPISIESSFSLAPGSEVVSTTQYIGRPNIQSGIEAADHVTNAYLADHYYEGVTVPVREAVTNPIHIMSIIWLVGMIVMIAYAGISYLHLHCIVRESVRYQENIFLCDRISTPFILGIVRPRIYLPSSIDESQINSVVAHESAHIARLDHMWKPLGYLLLSVYWFHPLCWLAFILFCRDMEMACDEKVVKNLGVEEKKQYARVLLSFSAPGKMISACPLSFGEVGVKKRVKNILNYKKPAFWVTLVAVAITAMVGVCFLTDPKSAEEVNVREGIYWADLENELMKPYIEFQPDHTFVFTYDLFSSYLNCGNYEIRDGKVICKTSDGKYRFVFSVMDEDTLRFEQEESSAIQMITDAAYDMDGMLFVYEKDTWSQDSNENMNQGIESESEEEVEVVIPTLDLNATTGADGSSLYYADRDKFIFAGYYGLFVYDRNQNEIIRSMDLISLGCQNTQGDEVCEIRVTEDGSQVLLHPMNQEYMYVYRVNENILTKRTYSIEGYAFYDNQYTGSETGKYASYEKDGEIEYVTLVNDITIGELGYTEDVLQSSYRRIFGE